jgi:AraC-like DNA-binding protein
MRPTRGSIEDHRVPSDFVRLLFEYLENRGLDAAALLQMPKPRAEELGVGSYSHAQWTAMLERAQQHLDDAQLGLHLGQTATAAHFGLLGYLLSNSNNLAEALARGAKYWRLFRPYAVRMRHWLQDGSVSIEWDLAAEQHSALSEEASVTALAQLARSMTGENLRAQELCFMHPAPGDTRGYDAYFGCAVRFDHPVLRLRFAAGYLQLGVRNADRDLLVLLENQANTLLAGLPDGTDFEQTVRGCIARVVASSEPSVDQVAGLLHLSPRTLQRRLDDNDLNFRGLLDDTRRRLAENYLLDPTLQLKDVAHLLGFSEQSAFTRAFRRWTGISPREFVKARNSAGQI